MIPHRNYTGFTAEHHAAFARAYWKALKGPPFEDYEEPWKKCTTRDEMSLALAAHLGRLKGIDEYVEPFRKIGFSL